jgi:lauroyl/myristoyl acyltransferase
VTDDWLAWAVAGLRARAGLGLLYDTEPAARAASLLRSGEAVLVLGDYAKGPMRTYPVRLLDAVAELPAGPAALARLCGTPIVPFTVLPLGPRRWRVEAELPLSPPDRDSGPDGERALLQALADRWTAQLRALGGRLPDDVAAGVESATASGANGRARAERPSSRQ